MENIKLQRYPAYKDSGVEWLGEIPEHWEVLRIKHLFKEINERSVNGSEELLSVSQYTGVTRKSDKVETGDLLTTATTLEGYRKVYKGDLVSNIMLAWNGSLGFSPFDGITSPAYSTYRLQCDNNKGYFHYLLRTDIYKSEFKRNSSGVIDSRLRLYTDDFFRIIAILPPIEEQTAIAYFLDNKTALIDKAISLKQKQIELLKERRQILIHRAVTRGLNPDAKFKDSGVKWIGDIPEHWEVKKLKHLSQIIDCKNRTPEYLDGGKYLVVRTSNVKDGKLIYDKRLYTDKRNYAIWTERGIPKVGSVLFTREAPAGEACLVPNQIELCLGQRMMSINGIMNQLSNKYLLLIIYSPAIQIYIELMSSGSTVTHLRVPQIFDMPIAVPFYAEQCEIEEYLNIISEKIDCSITLKEKEIEKLKEYKNVLINEAVSGKIKVN